MICLLKEFKNVNLQQSRATYNYQTINKAMFSLENTLSVVGAGAKNLWLWLHNTACNFVLMLSCRLLLSIPACIHLHPSVKGDSASSMLPHVGYFQLCPISVLNTFILLSLSS